MERHIEKYPPSRRESLVEAAFDRPVRRGACRRVSRIGARRPAKDIARHLVEEQHQGRGSFWRCFPRPQRPGGGRFVIGQKFPAQCRIELLGGLEPDLAVPLAPRVALRPKPEIEQRCCPISEDRHMPH